jgi:hypothetical protein
MTGLFELNAQVEQYGDLFKIYNNDSFDWYNVIIILNQDNDDMSSGFICEYYIPEMLVQ